MKKMQKITAHIAAALFLAAALAAWTAWAVYAHTAARVCGLDLPTCAERAGYPYGTISADF